jgi:hypothetical protein
MAEAVHWKNGEKEAFLLYILLVHALRAVSLAVLPHNPKRARICRLVLFPCLSVPAAYSSNYQDILSQTVCENEVYAQMRSTCSLLVDKLAALC